MAEANSKDGPNRQVGLITNPSDMADTLEVGGYVLVQKEMGSQKTWCQILGWIIGKFLFLDGPSLWVGRGNLFKGNAILGRYLRLGRLYGFKCAVHEVVRDPLIVIVEWPEQVEAITLSSEMRAKTSFPVTLMAAGVAGGGQIEAKLRDLSPLGCQLAIDSPPEEAKNLSQGDTAQLMITLPPEDQATALKADVRNVQARGRELLLGLRFQPGQPEVLTKITNLIKLQLNQE